MAATRIAEIPTVSRSFLIAVFIFSQPFILKDKYIFGFFPFNMQFSLFEKE